MSSSMRLGGGDVVIPRHIQVVFLEFLSDNGADTTLSIPEEEGGVHRALFDGKVGINHIPDSHNVGNPIGVIVLLDDDAMTSAGILQMKLGEAGFEAEVYATDEDTFITVACEKERIAFRFKQL